MLTSFPAPITACVFGASGGIGAALVRALVQLPAVSLVHAGARTPLAPAAKLRPFRFDLEDEESLAQAACAIGQVDLVIVATGLLHAEGLTPEKSARAQSAAAYARAFAINATGPALIAKHVLPNFARDRRAAFAALSARVSSISDNRMGGWHAYRASKAALNMIVRTLALELARTHSQAVAVTLHPGTVDTPLSRPFQRGVVPEKLFTADVAAAHLLRVIDGLQPEDSGHLFAWDDQRIPF